MTNILSKLAHNVSQGQFSSCR